MGFMRVRKLSERKLRLGDKNERLLEGRGWGSNNVLAMFFVVQTLHIIL